MAPIEPPTRPEMEGSSEIHPDDERLMSQLAALQQMHEQIGHLRTLPQELVSPLTQTIQTKSLQSQDPSQAAILYSKVEKVAMQSVRDIERFKEDWMRKDIQELWKRTQKSPCPQGTSIWFTDYAAELKVRKSSDQGKVPEQSTIQPDSGSPKDILEAFLGRNALVIRTNQASDELFPIKLTVAEMALQIVSQGTNDQIQYNVEDGSEPIATELRTSVVKNLNARRDKKSLLYLLNMIGAYSDIKKRPCDRCKKLFDQNLSFPTIRNDKSPKTSDKSSEILWEAVHQSCS